jgi:hypothetical protein
LLLFVPFLFIQASHASSLLQGEDRTYRWPLVLTTQATTISFSFAEAFYPSSLRVHQDPTD